MRMIKLLLFASLFLCQPVWSAQFARPDGDFATNGWTVPGGGNLFEAID